MHIAFDGPVGAINVNTVFPDSSGNGYNMSLINQNWGGNAAYTSGKFGNAVQINSAIMVMLGPAAGSKPLPTLNQWTVSEWVNFSSSVGDSWVPFFGMWNGFGANLSYDPATSDLQSWVKDSSGNSIIQKDITVSIPAGQWDLVTETVTAGQYNLYINGVNVDSVATNPAQTPLFMSSDADPHLGV